MGKPTLRETVYTDEFCRKHGRILYSLAFRILGDSERARDLVQEVWMRALKYGAEFRHEAERTTYLYRITANECLRQLEGSKRIVEDPNVEQLLSEDIDQHQVLELGELIQEVDGCLQGLTPLQNMVLTLHIHGGLLYKEIAGELGVTEDVVAGAISRGRRQIKRALEKRGVNR